MTLTLVPSTNLKDFAQSFALDSTVKMKFFVFVFSLAALWCAASGGKILFVGFITSVSNRIVFQRLLRSLADRGHHVTIATTVDLKSNHENITETVVITAEQLMKELKIGAKTFDQRLSGSAVATGFMPPVLHFAPMLANICRIGYSSPNLHNLLKEDFDLLLVSPLLNECLYGFLHKLGAPIILLAQFSILPTLAGQLGSPSPPSFVPSAFTSFSDDMTFWERVQNFLITVETWAVNDFYYEPMVEELYRKALNDSTLPSVKEIEKNVALVLENQDGSYTRPRPRMADIISVGGMHMYPPKPLPKDLADFADGAGSDGFIFFSMGSALRSSEMPENIRKMFLKVFGSLKQRVIWKWETEQMDEEVPANVKLSKWVPQMDLLAHKNIKAFISHGGHGGLTEAIYNGVPLIGIPMFTDQFYNVRIASKLGFGIGLEISELTEHLLRDAIEEIITNVSYSKSAKERSSIFHERSQDPLETAVFWTEYVMKHKGAPHLRSAARDLSFFQYYSLDVMCFLSATIGLFLIMFFFVCMKALSMVRKCLGFLKDPGNRAPRLKSE